MAKFTTYYSNLIKANGVPHLNVKQHARLMNIIVLEAGMQHLEKLSCEGKSLANKNKMLYNLNVQLRTLTQNEPPESIMKAMIEDSE